MEAGSTPLFPGCWVYVEMPCPRLLPLNFYSLFFFQGSLKWGAKYELWEFEGSFPPSRFAYSVGNGISQQDVEPQR